NPRSLANFPMQGNGAEILRLACSMLTEAGVTVCAPVHDAVLIEADESEIDQAVEHAQGIMTEASRVVLGGFTIGTDAKIVRHPQRYMDARGRPMWETIGGIVDRLEGSNATIREDSQA
ncbi:DNA polymerase I, partial [bacterium]|nr:DNA polymerase I [bacterium]